MSMSAYDEINVAIEKVKDPTAKKRLETAMDELDKVDDSLHDIGVHLEAYEGLYKDKELTVARMNQFFEEMLPDIIEKLNKLRERLY